MKGQKHQVLSFRFFCPIHFSAIPKNKPDDPEIFSTYPKIFSDVNVKAEKFSGNFFENKQAFKTEKSTCARFQPLKLAYLRFFQRINPMSARNDIFDSAAPDIYQIQTQAHGPAGSLPITDQLLRHSPSGDIFGLTQNAGMGWNPAEAGRKQFLILSTQGGMRAPGGQPIALGLS